MWKPPDGRDWLRGKQGLLALVGMAMLNKSLIQFSVDGWDCVPPPCTLASGQTLIGVMVVMATSLKSTYASMYHLGSPNNDERHQ